MTLTSYRDLEVWQKSMELTVICYQLTSCFPKNETYGLSTQLQRAAVSIPSNIAEGRQRRYSKEFLQFLSIAYASLAELETHILIAARLNYIKDGQVEHALDKTSEIGRMLNGLQRSIEKKIRPIKGSGMHGAGDLKEDSVPASPNPRTLIPVPSSKIK